MLSPEQILERSTAGIGGLNKRQAARLAELVRHEQPTLTLETGFAHGISTVFICGSLSAGARHIVIDPFQHEWYKGAGLANVEAAGFGDMIDFREQPSEVVLAEFDAAGTKIDFAFIDSSHELDRTVVELFYIDRMLKPSGLLVLDDTQLRNVRQVARWAVVGYGYRDESRLADTGPWRNAGRRALRLLRGVLGIGAAIRFALGGVRSELLYLEAPWPREHGLAILRKPAAREHVDWRVDNPI